jgi:predicted MFS family arabinose efflux permease
VSAPAARDAQAAIFHGWKILGTVFLTMGLATAFTTYGFGFFSLPVGREFGVSRSTVTLGMTAHMLVVALFSPWLGRRLDTRPIRSIMLAGALCLSASLGIIAVSKSLLLTGIAFSVGISVAMACIGPLAAGKLISAWFFKQRGRALGISAIGTSVAGFLAPPLLQLAIDTWGWRGAAAAAGIVSALISLPIIALFIRDRPSDLGLFPDGAAAQPPPPPGGVVSWNLGSLARDRNFWVITLAAGGIMATVGALVPNLTPYLDTVGIEPQRAALLFPVLSTGGIIGKLAFAAVGDRFDTRLLLVLTHTLIASFLLILMAQPGYAALAAGFFIVGLALGGVMPLWGAILAETYGSESFGQVMGTMAPAMLPLNMLFMQLLPWSWDTYETYTPAFQACLATLLLAALATSLLRRPHAES